MVKVKRLGLETGKGIVYTVSPDGQITKSHNGQFSVVKKVKLTDTKDFLYGIDEDGDLAREYKHLPNPDEAWPKSHPTKPASAKLGTRELVRRISALLFPPDADHLAHAGYVELWDDIKESRKIYLGELQRLAAEIAYALGPGELIETAYGSPGFLWDFRGRKALLTLDSEDKEFPCSISITWIDDDSAKKLKRVKKHKTW